LKIIDSLICKWDCGNSHNFIDDCAGLEEEEYQDCLDPYTNLDICGWGFLLPLL
jgi:hypothetical protein